MTIEQANELKASLESTISGLLSQFVDKTGLEILGVSADQDTKGLFSVDIKAMLRNK